MNSESSQPQSTNSSHLSRSVAPKKHRRIWGIIGSVLLIVLGTGLGYAFFVFVYPPNPTPAPQTPSSATTETLRPEEVIAQLKTTFAATYQIYEASDNTSPNPGEMFLRSVTYAPAYKTEGYDFYTAYEGGVGLQIVVDTLDGATAALPLTADSTVRTQTIAVYKSVGLTKTGTIGNTEQATEQEVYTGKGLVCTIEAPSSATSPSTASCGKIAAYAPVAKQIQPLAKVIPNLTPSTVLAGLKITDSPIEGYQRASMTIGSVDGGGGAVVLLYKKGSGEWIFFTATQAALPCSAYKTTDLTNAFRGETCTGATDAQTTVQ